MNMMLEQFKTIFDRPERVKKLREVILDLAVRGKLVEQDPNDEPASVLSERIREEKERLVWEKKFKKENPLVEIGEEEKPYELPKGWQWIRLGDYCIINPRNSVDDNEDASFVPMRLINDGFDNKHSYEIKKWKEIKSGFTHFAEKDVVVAKITPCFENRKSAVMKNLINKVGAGTTELYVIRSINNLILPEYILSLCKTETFIKGGLETYTGTAGQQRVKKDYIHNLVVALPPLEEQKRIVEKVDSLMFFCDKLEESLEKKVHYGLLSAKSVFNSIGNVTTTEELEETLRFILSNFKDLSLGANAVKELKNCILQLAVQGKLVPQDPSDEPAEVILEKIRDEKERLIKEKKLKKEKALAEISEDENPYELQKGWKWAHINEIAFVTKLAGFEYTKYLSNGITYEGDVPIVRAQNIKMNNFIENTQEFISFDLSEKLSRSALYKKCIVITFIGAGIGEVAIFDKVNRYHLAPNVAKIEIFNNFSVNVDEKYALYYLMSSIGRKDIFRFLKATAQPSLSMETIRKVRVALPPLQEQKRIVEKVDSLIQLCDELEKKIEKSKDYSNRLMESILKSSSKTTKRDK